VEISNFNRIVPGTIRSVIRNKNPIIRSDGSFIRDYFYIKNGASAYVHLAEKMEDTKIHGEAFNFSNEQPLSVIEITQLILQVMGREDLKPEIRNEASNEIPEQWLSSEKAKKMLDWKAKFSIKEGLAETVEWYKELLK